jgi:hypothetical protein
MTANGTSTFGVIADFDPEGQDGTYNMISTIVNGSGGDTNSSNNTDNEIITFFK